MTIQEKDVRVAVGRVIRFGMDGSIYEGKIDKALLTPIDISLIPDVNKAIVEPFVGIKVRMRDGGEMKLMFDDRRIEYIEF